MEGIEGSSQHESLEADLGSILLGLNDNRASSLTICQARYIGHGSHVCNEVGLVLAGGHQGVVHILLIKQQPLWHLGHACKQFQQAYSATLTVDSSDGKQLQQAVTPGMIVHTNNRQ